MATWSDFLVYFVDLEQNKEESVARLLSAALQGLTKFESSCSTAKILQQRNILAAILRGCKFLQRCKMTQF